MQEFLNDDFLLSTQTAKWLYHEHGEKMPIIDFHNHLNPKEIYEDHCYENLTQAWLGGDHYKWRAMRAAGVPECLITGNGGDYEKFLAWAKTVQAAIGNPLYHWTHLELRRYFGVTEPLNPASAPGIWEACNARLRSREYSVRGLLRRQGVRVLCTTDDPVDSLEYHRKLREKVLGIRVLPTFRPEKAMGLEKPDYLVYLDRLGQAAGVEIKEAQDVYTALTKRLLFFVENGCRVSDHSLEGPFYTASGYEEVKRIFEKRKRGEALTERECAAFRGWLLAKLGREYARYDMVMQLHIGALRNNSTRLSRCLGADAGLDSINDFYYARELSELLDAMDQTDELPRSILYYLNPKDADMLAAMAGNFQSNEKGIRGKVQLGSAWWFCDHKAGMERQLETLANVGMLSTFVGMLTDSRSFLSFPRHEYFRRILCNKIGTWVEAGEYPADREYLGKLVEDICYRNADEFFGFSCQGE